MEQTWTNIQNKLINDYQEFHQKYAPVWAVHKVDQPDQILTSTIPFVGKEYAQQEKKVLIYASAENLTHYRSGAEYSETLRRDDTAINRHRICFDRDDSRKFFPNVHIAPMNNGYLATAIYYVVTQLLGTKEFEKPRKFYERIAFGNYGKYSIETRRQKAERLGYTDKTENLNQDYAYDQGKLERSHAFIYQDIEILKPDYWILPKTIYDTDHAFIESIKGNAIIIPLFQMNARVVNCLLKRKFEGIALTALPEHVAAWYNALTPNKTRANYRFVFSYLDTLLRDI